MPVGKTIMIFKKFKIWCQIQDNNFDPISLNILMTCLLDNVKLLQGEVTCQSLLGVKGLSDNQYVFNLFYPMLCVLTFSLLGLNVISYHSLQTISPIQYIFFSSCICMGVQLYFKDCRPMFIYHKEGKCLNQLADFPLKQIDITFIFW